MTGSIGGVPSMPNLDSASVKKLALEEEKLLAAQGRVEELIQKNPKQAAKLQESLDLIKQNFSKIMFLKYAINVGEFLDHIDDVAAITAEIAAVTAQINALADEIEAKNDLIADKQAQIAANQAQENTNLTRIDTLDAEILALAPAATSAVTTISAFLSSQSPISLYAALNANGFGDTSTNLLNAWNIIKTQSPVGIHDFLTILNHELDPVIEILEANGVHTTIIVNMRDRIVAEADPLVQMENKANEQSSLLSANISLEAANQALASEITGLQLQIAALVTQQTTLNTTLTGLNAQLAAAQSAVTFFNSLSETEKTLFRELYPGVTFP